MTMRWFSRPGFQPGRLLLILVFLLAALEGVQARDEPAPVIDAASEPGISTREFNQMNDRLSRLERILDNQALIEILNRIENLQNELQLLNGQIEEQGHNLENLQKRQRDLYLDIDQRLISLEEAQASAPPAPALPPVTAPPVMPQAPAESTADAVAPPAATTTPPAETAAINPQLERKNYEMAFNLLKDGRYDQAVAAFQAFLVTYPNGRFADNAQYWLGEANYVQRRYPDALAEFQKVLTNFPDSPKRADAMLKMGYTYQELGDVENAHLILNEIVSTYPNTTAANLANKRLQEIKRQQ